LTYVRIANVLFLKGPLDFIYFLLFHHFTAEPQRLPSIANFLTKVIQIIDENSGFDSNSKDRTPCMLAGI
jgi:hypothetical protein